MNLRNYFIFGTVLGVAVSFSSPGVAALNQEQIEEKRAHIAKQHERILGNLQKKYDEGEFTKKQYNEEVEWHEEELEERQVEFDDAIKHIDDVKEDRLQRKKKADESARAQLKIRLKQIEEQKRLQAEQARLEALGQSESLPD